MSVVWKYTLRVTATATDLAIPDGAAFLAADAQDDPEFIDLWFQVDPDEHVVPRPFAVTGTGMATPPDSTWRATVRHRPSMLVWHVWEAQ